MTVEEDWFEPLPIDEYTLLNKHSSDDIPDEIPVDPPLDDGLDIRCGPILRLSGTLENQTNNYRGSIMLVVCDSASVSPKITYKIGPSANTGKFSVLDGEFPATKYHEVAGYAFWRFEINLLLADHEQVVKYFINNSYKKSQQFFIPAVDESMNVVSFSCNGFSLGTDTAAYKSSLWLDVLKKHQQQHYHVMLGGGDQIYCDAIKLKSLLLKKWTQELNPLKKMKMVASDEMIAEFEDYYLNAYLGWFGKGYWVGTKGKTLQKVFPLAMAQIPSVNLFDDHDIIDGFGSYHDTTMKSDVFSTIGNVAYKYYMLFQHQMSTEEKAHLQDPSWILSKSKGPFIKQQSHSVFMRLGKEISLLGVDCRTERKLKQVISYSTYDVIFDRLQKEITHNSDTKHLLVMLGVPILYPRLVWLEWILTSPVLKPIRKLAERGVIAKGLVNDFDGGVEVLDDLNDHWCSKHHKRERNYLLMRLLEFGSAHGVRITILSGDVHLCCIGRLKSKIRSHIHSHLFNPNNPQQIQEMNKDVMNSPEYDPRLLFNVISSAIINAPPPDAMAGLLNKRSKIHNLNRDTHEDIVPLFKVNPDLSERTNLQFLNKRNWSDLILAKNSAIYKDKLLSDIKKFPGPVVEKDLYTSQKLDERYIKYPLRENSLVTTLHVEVDGNNFDADTTGYEVLIPDLVGHHALDKTLVKHLDEDEESSA